MSDRLPMSIVPQVESSSTKECKSIRWDQFSDFCINDSTKVTKYNLENVNIPGDSIIYNDVNSIEDEHISMIISRQSGHKDQTTQI